MILVSLAVATSLAAFPSTGIAGVNAARATTTQNLAPGLTYTKITDPAGPNRVYVLTVDPSRPLSLDAATAGGVGSFARPSSIGAAHSALAAINGDFSIDPGRPLHPFAEDGVLRQFGLQNGASFGISQDETRKYIAQTALTATGENLSSKTTFSISEFNTGAPAGSQIAAYTPYGGGRERPPTNACSVRLNVSGKLHWGPRGIGVNRDWIVSRARCSSTRLGVRAGTVVLSSHLTGAGSRILKRMKKGQLVRLGWSAGWSGVMDTVGGMPLLVDAGQAVAPATCSSYFCSRNPRAGIGITSDGKVLLVVVDGRSPGSVGMTLIGFAHYMQQLGATYAVNLDGGGGAAMWIAGQGIVSRPSDSSGERPVTNAVLVLPGSDGEPTPLPYARGPVIGRITQGPSDGITRIASALQAQRSIDAALADPGSTGGLMNALASGRLGQVGGTGSLPDRFLRMARAFRASHR